MPGSGEMMTSGPARALRTVAATGSCGWPCAYITIAAMRTAARPRSMRGPLRPIDINTATKDELTTLPGVGPAIALRIIEARPCQSADELLQVKGINRKRLEEIQPLIRLD